MPSAVEHSFSDLDTITLRVRERPLSPVLSPLTAAFSISTSLTAGCRLENKALIQCCFT